MPRRHLGCTKRFDEDIFDSTERALLKDPSNVLTLLRFTASAFALLLFFRPECAPTTNSPVAVAQSPQIRLSESDAPKLDSWRRTVDGWEKNLSKTSRQPPPIAASIHPLLVAAVQLLITIAAFTAFEDSVVRKRSFIGHDSTNRRRP